MVPFATAASSSGPSRCGQVAVDDEFAVDLDDAERASRH
jgi:hypothetical protein